jgi:hypothetical protein
VGLRKERAGHRRGDRAGGLAIDLIAEGPVSSQQEPSQKRLEAFGLIGVAVVTTGQAAMQLPCFLKTLGHTQRLLAHHATEKPGLSFQR